MQVKPYYLDPVLEALKPHITERHLIISIVAGVKLAWLESNLPGARLVRPSSFSSRNPAAWIGLMGTRKQSGNMCNAKFKVCTVSK